MTGRVKKSHSVRMTLAICLAILLITALLPVTQVSSAETESSWAETIPQMLQAGEYQRSLWLALMFLSLLTLLTALRLKRRAGNKV